ncbi:tRNA:m(4)X modification enzyme TRM13 [Bulinus truncatus]|nr:tRNA:m(4)X modification enzyme TRM13 [Bulinus truncatus]
MDSKDNTDNKESCTFYLTKKRRFCRFRPKQGQLYCPEHSCIMGVNNDRKRIPCPLNPTHNCYEDDLEKHLKKCNVTKIKNASEQSVYFKKGINKDSCPEIVKSEEERICVKDLSSVQLSEMIDRVNKLFDAHVNKVNKVVIEHDCVRDEICGIQNEDLSSAFGMQAALRKELLQQASLVGQLDKLSLLTDGNCFVELGAGKGKLSHWIQKASVTCPNNSFVLVERSSVRYKMDSFHKQGGNESCFHRIKIDIEDLNLGCVPEVEKASSVIVVGKHLCGGATDMGIRCATNTLNSQSDTSASPSDSLTTDVSVHSVEHFGGSTLKTGSHGADDIDLDRSPVLQTSSPVDSLCKKNAQNENHVKTICGESAQKHSEDLDVKKLNEEIWEPPQKTLKLDENKRQLKGIMIALCCHHQCTWESYCGKDFMQSVGISPADFNLLTRLSSWATCAKLTAHHSPESDSSDRKSFPVIVRNLILTNGWEGSCLNHCYTEAVTICDNLHV